MRYLIVPVILTFLLSACSQPEQQADFELTVAHINDTHSAFDPTPGSFVAQQETVFNEFGGHPRLLQKAQYLEQYALQHNLPFLFLHGGDAWQGSAYFKVNEGRMNADILNQMNLDAMALGNHEFDLTNALLNEFISAANFPVLAANIDTSEDADLADQTNLRAYTVFGFDGTRKERFEHPSDVPENMVSVAVFGLALEDMPDIAPNTGDVRFFSMVESAQRTVDMLQAAGVQHVVALTHIGHALDVEVASQVNGIDAIVGGHSHTLLGDFSDLGWGSNGEYAQWVQTPDGGRTCIVQAGEYAQAIGFVTLNFNAEGELKTCEGNNRLLSNETFYSSAERQQQVSSDRYSHIRDFADQHSKLAIVQEHPELRAHIDRYYRPAVEEAYGQVIGMVPATLRHVRRPGDGGSDRHGSEVAPLVATAQYWFAALDVVYELTGRRADFALVGAGGIRQHIEEGELREGDISLELLPFASGISLLSLTGRQVKELLEQVVEQTLPDGAHAGKFPYGGMLRYTFNELEPGVSGEVSELEVNRGSWLDPVWQPIDSESEYHVAINGYNATGNDGWNVVFEAQRESTDRIDLVSVDGILRAYSVDSIERDEQQRLQVIYSGEVLDCTAQNVDCSTDAQAVIDFVRSELQSVTPLPYPVVTFNRAPDSEQTVN